MSKNYNQNKNKYVQKYIHEHYKQIVLRLPTAGDVTRETIAAAAATAGASVNAFIIDAVREKMNQGPTATGDGKTEKENPPRVSDHIEENPGGVSSDPEENPGRDPEEKTGGALSSENITPEPVRTPFIEDP